MNWLLAIVAATGILAGPVVASVVAPGFMTGVAEKGFAVNHRHFVFNEMFPVNAGGQEWDVRLYDGDLYEQLLTTQVVLRGAVIPAPTDEELQMALRKVGDRYDLPLLGYDVERSGEEITLRATLPAGVVANLSPQYQRLMSMYEA